MVNLQLMIKQIHQHGFSSANSSIQIKPFNRCIRGLHDETRPQPPTSTYKQLDKMIIKEMFIHPQSSFREDKLDGRD